MTPEQLNTKALELILETLQDLASDTMSLGERIADEYPDYVPEDIEALAKLIDEGREMFHEVWSMGS